VYGCELIEASANIKIRTKWMVDLSFFIAKDYTKEYIDIKGGLGLFINSRCYSRY